MSTGAATGGNSGDVIVGTGSSSQVQAGSIQVTVGSGSSGLGGQILMSAGYSSASDGGRVRISTGSASSTSGPLLIQTANSGPSGQSGTLSFRSVIIFSPAPFCFVHSRPFPLILIFSFHQLRYK